MLQTYFCMRHTAEGLIRGRGSRSHVRYNLNIFTPAPGLERLAKWMRARLFITNFRPVPLTEHVVFQGVVYVKVGPICVWSFDTSHRTDLGTIQN